MMASASVRDLVGVGIGPANLSLAALAQPLAGLDAVFFEQRRGFEWHPGLLIEGARLQVPFLADLVSLADPTSRWSFLNHLRARERLFPFYFSERPHILRAEYEGYCRWVAERLPSLRFGHQVDAVRWNPRAELFEVDFGQVDAGAGWRRWAGCVPGMWCWGWGRSRMCRSRCGLWWVRRRWRCVMRRIIWSIVSGCWRRVM